MQFDPLKRREFIALVGGAAATWPLAVRAQQPTLPVIGFLHQASPEATAAPRAAFEQGLKQAGFIENQNVRIEYRWAEDHNDQLPQLAADLVRRQVALTVTPTPAMEAAQAATTTIPIVFVSADDPVRLGLVASFDRPGGNATGIYFLIAALEAKRAELLHEIVPKSATIALLLDPNFPSAGEQKREMQAAMRSLGLNLLVLNAGNASEIDVAFTRLVNEGAGALAVAATGLYFYRREQLVALAARHRVPTVYPWREAVTAGGLMSYGSSVTDAYRQAGIYSGHILKGAKPADLPVQQSVKVEFVINLKTAKSLGLTFPITLLGRADEAIE
jgi:ABC-type uncharacterized transport system substrate-binding protein